MATGSSKEEQRTSNYLLKKMDGGYVDLRRTKSWG